MPPDERCRRTPLDLRRTDKTSHLSKEGICSRISPARWTRAIAMTGQLDKVNCNIIKTEDERRMSGRLFRAHHILIPIFSVTLGLSGCVTNKDGVQVSTDHSRAVSGERTKMGQSYNLNANCTAATMPSIKLVQPPAHGSVEFVSEKIFSHYSTGAPQIRCNSRKSPGVSEYYTSNSGYSGKDMYKVRVSYGEGTIKDVTVNINVRKK
ncbi:UNVERIFIED_ORG: hypothetical protein GGD47_001099 [Rhizobium etli]